MKEEVTSEKELAEEKQATIPIIRRRVHAAKGNLRKRTDRQHTNDGNDVAESKNENGESSDDELGIDRQKLGDLKLVHSFKVHKPGISAEALARGEGKDKKSGSIKDLKSTFASQFNSRMDHGLQSTVPHENIMEDFINQKLGLKTSNEPM